jgi:hypothetical protein
MLVLYATFICHQTFNTKLVHSFSLVLHVGVWVNAFQEVCICRRLCRRSCIPCKEWRVMDRDHEATAIDVVYTTDRHGIVQSVLY